MIDGTDPFVAAKPDARLVNLLIRAHRFNATLIGSADLRFAALAKQEGVKPCNYWPHGVVAHLSDHRLQGRLRAAERVRRSDWNS